MELSAILFLLMVAGCATIERATGSRIAPIERLEGHDAVLQDECLQQAEAATGEDRAWFMRSWKAGFNLFYPPAGIKRNQFINTYDECMAAKKKVGDAE